MATKVCSTCKVEKDISNFSKLNRNKDGLRPECKMCNKDYYIAHIVDIKKRKKKYRLDNKDRIKKIMKDYYNNNKCDILKRMREQYIDNKIIINKRNRQYYANNKNSIHKRMRFYQQTPMGKIVSARGRHKRRDLAKNTPYTLTLEQWNKIIEMQDNKCADISCRKPFTKQNPPTKDHIIPLNPRDKSYKSGGLTFENTRAVCQLCNIKKSNKIDKGLIQTWLV